MVYNPFACVDHIGAPQPGGRRFGVKYEYYHARNNLVMLLRNHGAAFVICRYVASVVSIAIATFIRRIGASFLRLFMVLSGVIAGLVIGCQLRLKGSGGPIRRDECGKALTQTISMHLDGSEKVARGMTK